MRKTARPSPLIDIFHRGFVVSCLGLTAYGLFIGGHRFYHYLTVTRPARALEKQELLKDDEELRS